VPTRLSNSIYLFNLAYDLFHAARSKGWVPDWELAHHVYHDFLDRAETLPRNMYVEVAYKHLAEFYRGETLYNQFWPLDLEKAEYYSDLHIDRLKQRGVSAEELGAALKKREDLDRLIASSVGYLSIAIANGADQMSDSSIIGGKYAVEMKVGDEIAGMRPVDFSIRGTRDTPSQICITLSDTAEVVSRNSGHKAGELAWHSMLSDGNYPIVFASTISLFSVTASSLSGRKKFLVQIEENVGAEECEWWRPADDGYWDDW
jgi:hypothetical protein